MHATLRRGIGTTLLCAPLFALAHHAEGYAPPATIAASLLSGLAHPAIEIGQVAFLIALGAVCARWPQGAAVIARFVAGSALGVLLAALGAIAPAEPLLPLALLGVAAVLAWRGDRIGTGPAGAAVASAATALAGLVHGQAAVEPAIGAAAGVFLAYASAMLVAQVAIVLLARTVLAAALPADPAIRRRTWNAVAAGSAVAAVAVAVQPGLALL